MFCSQLFQYYFGHKRFGALRFLQVFIVKGGWCVVARSCEYEGRLQHALFWLHEVMPPTQADRKVITVDAFLLCVIPH